MTQRIAKVNSLVKEEVGKILNQEDIFPRDIMVTVIDADTSVDIKHAKITIDVLPPNKLGQVLRIIQRNIYDIQQVLNKTLVLKFVPKIRFVPYEGQRSSERIEQVIKEEKNNEIGQNVQ